MIRYACPIKNIESLSLDIRYNKIENKFFKI